MAAFIFGSSSFIDSGRLSVFYAQGFLSSGLFCAQDFFALRAVLKISMTYNPLVINGTLSKKAIRHGQ